MKMSGAEMVVAKHRARGVQGQDNGHVNRREGRGGEGGEYLSALLPEGDGEIVGDHPVPLTQDGGSHVHPHHRAGHKRHLRRHHLCLPTCSPHGNWSRPAPALWTLWTLCCEVLGPPGQVAGLEWSNADLAHADVL